HAAGHGLHTRRRARRRHQGMARSGISARAGRERRTVIPSRGVAGAIGVAWLVLTIASLIALGAPPDAAASGETVVAWFQTHRDAIRWWVWCITVSGPLLA